MVVIVNATTGALMDTIAPGMSPTWSPDGRQLAFVANGITVRNVDGTNPKVLPVTGYDPAWSPDGDWIAFAADSGVHLVSPAASVSPPEPPPVWVSLDAGTAATCGVAADGRGYCWGQKWAAGRGGPRTALIAAPRELPLRNWVTIEAGHSIACGLTRDHETYCWGFPTSGVDTVPGRIPGDAGF